MQRFIDDKWYYHLVQVFSKCIKTSNEKIYKKQGKIVAKLLSTEVTVISHIACTYVFAKKSFRSKVARRSSEVPPRLRDGRPKFRNAKAKQIKTGHQREKGKEEELQRSFANCLRRSTVSKRPL